MDILAEANRLIAGGADVISMAVGQPADPAPRAVREAAERAVRGGRLGYTDALGRSDLRRAIARYYGEQHNLDIDPARIVVTTGSSAGFNLAFLALFDPGARIAVTVPGYPAYRNILRVLGLEPVEIRVGGDAAPHLTAAMLEAEHGRGKLDGVLFASPANPTGAIIPGGALRDLVTKAGELGITVISDEIYHGLNFAADDCSALSVADDLVVINSFSKYYCMTGWRIGWMVVPPMVARSIERIAQSLYISAPEHSQIAAIEAFSGRAELQEIKGRYGANREFLAARLPELGMPLAFPVDGAFYAYCDLSRHTDDTMAFARRMLDEIHVAATPGLDFDPEQGGRMMRFSYAGAPDRMREAVSRIASWLPTVG
jgi:aspartate/methionine/tyrosine aminotransferase